MASEPPDSGWTLGDIGHGLLDIAGLVPGYGEAADLTNAAWYAGEEQYLDAGLSLISCVPIVGDAIGKGGKLAGKLGGPALKKILPLLKKMNFAEALAPFRNNKRLGPYIDKMVEALNKWRHKLIAKALGCEACAAKYDGPLYRAVGPTHDPLLVHSGNVAANHRYSAPGQGALYLASGKHIVEAEIGKDVEKMVMHSFPNVKVDNLLDLSNPAVRDQLGVTLEEITRVGGDIEKRYEVTHMLGEFAQAKGFKGIIAPSAQADGGVNVIVFAAESIVK